MKWIVELIGHDRRWFGPKCCFFQWVIGKLRSWLTFTCNWYQARTILAAQEVQPALVFREAVGFLVNCMILELYRIQIDESWNICRCPRCVCSWAINKLIDSIHDLKAYNFFKTLKKPRQGYPTSLTRAWTCFQFQLIRKPHPAIPVAVRKTHISKASQLGLFYVINSN